MWFWNLIHYNMYVFYQKAHLMFNLINPFRRLYNIRYIKEYMSRRGVKDLNKLIDNAYSNPRTGISILWAGIFMGGILIIVEYSFFNLIQIFIGKSLVQYIWNNSLNKILFAILLLIPAGLVNYFIIFRKNRYIEYFNEFKNIPRGQSIKNGWICFAFIIFILLFLISSFIILSKSRAFEQRQVLTIYGHK